VRGDNLSKIEREQGQGTTVGDVFEANRDTVTDPDRIFPGQVLRVPLF
jgi:nucleoid-associated protein YgaU